MKKEGMPGKDRIRQKGRLRKQANYHLPVFGCQAVAFAIVEFSDCLFRFERAPLDSADGLCAAAKLETNPQWIQRSFSYPCPQTHDGHPKGWPLALLLHVEPALPFVLAQIDQIAEGGG
jgi:hypothetical protein